MARSPKGGGDILPTEEAYISRSDQKDNWRLGCQVKIRNDMKIKVPDEIFSIRKWDAVVKSNDNVATFIKELILELPERTIQSSLNLVAIFKLMYLNIKD
jgi:Na+-transporting NADH:ubiquinone oxidoreductase, subunit NqrF